jgi:hypothetical protein
MKTSLIFTLIAGLAISCTATKESVKTEERYCIVVEEVKLGKRNAVIRPKSQTTEIKKIKIWYRYPTRNVFVGDTVDVSDRQIITGPRF